MIVVRARLQVQCALALICLSTLVSFASATVPSGVYARYQASNWDGSVLRDSSGNNRHSVYSSGVSKHVGIVGGSFAPVDYVGGGTSSVLHFPTNSIPSQFTICSSTRWSGGYKGRILQTAGTNWLHGHWNGRRGVAHYSNWQVYTGPATGRADDEWLVMCGKNSAEQEAFTVDGVPVSRTNGITPGPGNLQLMINDGTYAGEDSDWQLTEVIIWDRHLTTWEMQAATVAIDPARVMSFAPVPTGVYARYQANNWDGSVLRDSSGNNRHSVYSSGVSKHVGTVGGSFGPVDYVGGGTSSVLHFPTNSLPSQFTICSSTRWSGASKQRILQTAGTNWLHGHWRDFRGVAHYNGWQVYPGPATDRADDDWLVMCGKNSAEQEAFTVDGLPVSRRTYAPAGPGNLQLMINDGLLASEDSDWQLTEVIIWDRHLTTTEMQAASAAIDPATPRNDAFYFLHKVATPGPAHEDFCNQYGGTMATIFNQADQDAVVDFLNTVPGGIQSGYGLVHIGLHRCNLAPPRARSGCFNQNDPNEYVWSDGSRAADRGFFRWANTPTTEPTGKAYPVIDAVDPLTYFFNTNVVGGWANGDGSYWGLCQVRNVLSAAATCTSPGFTGSYYNSVRVHDTRVWPQGPGDVVRHESAVFFSNSGFPSGYNDYFSVKYEAYFIAHSAGDYTWQIGSDDGQRLTIDGVVRWEHFVLRPAAYDVVTVNLNAGIHYIVYEGYEHAGGAYFSVNWRRPGDSTYSRMTQDVYVSCCDLPETGAVPSQSCDSIPTCAAGYALAGSSCVPCPAGTYKALAGNDACDACEGNTGTGQTQCLSCAAGYTFSSGSCVKCAPGTYKDVRGRESCTSCGALASGETYAGTPDGLQSSASCNPTCTAGFYDNGGSCAQCPVGKFKAGNGDGPCTSCATNPGETFESVSAQGLTSSSACNPVCALGYEENGGNCVKCPAGKYKDAVGDDQCDSCAVGTGETFNTVSTTGLTRSDQCDPVCAPGYYDVVGTGCTECPAGRYKAVPGDQACSPCPLGTGETFETVSTTGLTASGQCVPVCDEGYYDNGGTCSKCAPGTYKDAAGNGACDVCPLTTGQSYVGTPSGLTVLDDCSPVCDAGYYFDSDSNGCEECAAGSFKTTPGNNACTPCSDAAEGEVYREEGLDDPDQCVPVCDFGFYDNGGTCTRCPAGTYKDFYGNEGCTSCPPTISGETWISTDDGLTSSDQCDPVCDLGFYSDDGVCTKCVPGTFKDFVGDDICTDCLVGLGETFDPVTEDGLTSAGQCNPVCDLGYYDDGVECTQCAPGTYKDSAGDEACTPCATAEGETFNTVVVRGLTGVEQCDPVCDLGYFDSAGTCTRCAPGTFKNEAGDGACSGCASPEEGETYETTPNGLTASNQCDPVCDLGYYDNAGTCVQCLAGTYKDAEGDQACQPCPAAITGETYTTTAQGLTASDECNPVCDVGYYDIAGTCTLCSAGMYKNTIGDEACVFCTTDTTEGVSTAAALIPNSHWTYDYTVPVTADACTWSCDAGYGGLLCEPCSAGEWTDGLAEVWEWCNRCEGAGLGKPPNSYYTQDGTDPAFQQSSAVACDYTCNGDYTNTACDAHPECPEGLFFHDSSRHLPDGQLAQNGSCWEYHALEEDFEGARKTCLDRGGDLVQIWTAIDNDLLAVARDTYTWINGGSSRMIHFGLWDRVDEATWTGVDGANRTEDDFVNWDIGEPSDDPAMNGEDCAAMGPGGRWYSNPCNTRRPYVCALPKPPVFYQVCDEQQSLQCDPSAYCIVLYGEAVCTCPEGYWGDGTSCGSRGYTVRFSIFLDETAVVTGGKLFYWNVMRDEYASLLTPGGYRTGGSNAPERRALPPGFLASMEHSVTALDDIQHGYVMLGANADTVYILTLNAVFQTRQQADDALEELLFNLQGNHSFEGLDSPSYPTVFGVTLNNNSYPVEPRVYTWVAPSTDAPQQIMATGMEVESVHFEPSCRQSGCWIVDVIFTVGQDNFNTFFLPEAVGSDGLSYDFDYDIDDDVWSMSPADTFLPVNFPCRSFDYDPEEEREDDPFDPINAPAEVTSCCLPEFLGMYRPIEGFVEAVSDRNISKSTCDAGIVRVFSRPNWTPPPPPGPSPYVGDAVPCPGTWPAELTSAVCYTPEQTAGQIAHAYAAGDQMAWLLTASPGSSVEIIFDFFESVEDMDWLRIYECSDEQCNTPTLLAAGSGAYNPFSVVSCTGFLLVTFVADAASPTGLGWMAKFYEIPTCPYSDATRTSLRAPTDGTDTDPNRAPHSSLDVVAKLENKLFGNFKGMNDSYVEFKSVEDPYIGQFRAAVFLDEVELRQKAGILKGTVGIEHTVDTFIGLANFKPTGIDFLDPFATQAAIHLEKTSFFTVSTHGTNDYTFLEYINLRLIAVYIQDADFSSTDEAGDRTVRTDANNQINYVQVTFTLGAQYKVGDNPEQFPLIPLDSVRAGYGTFFDSPDEISQKCTEYVVDDEAKFDSFDAPDGGLLGQECAPNAAMCVSPTSIADSFVAFNIPLGVNYFEAAGGPSNTLSRNIFVDMVVSAVEDTDGNPNQGDDPEQMKTTLTASIPLVEGGVNIFCDGFTAKTDLKDVADADIVVGSASSRDELTRLRIVSDVASTDLTARGDIQIDSDSIEAGLMTLVLKGNASYFARRGGVTIELEDVMTIHIMEADGNGGDLNGEAKTDAAIEVERLLAIAPQDNSLGGELDTDGYSLNGAFYFRIDRAAQRAHLEPSQQLLAACPLSPARPDPTAVLLETCVTRRDVRFRGYPARTGAKSTGMEICAGGTCPAADDETSMEAGFFETIFGQNAYARKLGSNHARTINDMYGLNGEYIRAYFINPGYEWTPTQTGGTPIFSVSQKLYLFALITLDEGIDGVLPGQIGPAPSLRRRMLLQSSPSTVDEALQDGQASIGGSVFEFQTTPSQMMAKAFEVPQDRVATFTVQLQLTQAEACMTDTELQGSIRATMDDYLLGTASPFHTVQITSMAVDRAGVQCARRRHIRSLLSSFSEATAEVTALIVFEEGQDSVISLDKLSSMAGIMSVEPLSVSPKVATDAPTTYVPPPPSYKGGSANGGDAEEGSSSNIAVIAGAAAGGAVVLIGIVSFMYMRTRSSSSEVMSAVQTINIDDLKQQLEDNA